MTLNDENHDVARYIKDLEERISDLEETGRGRITPNLLRTESEQVGVDDRLESVRERAMTAGAWNETGWRTSTWGQYD